VSAAGVGAAGDADLLADLAAEEESLRARVAALDREAWLAPTPSRFWDVRDTISHLAHTDDAAVEVCTGGRTLLEMVAGFASGEDFTLSGVLAGRRLDGPAVLEWWDRSAQRQAEVLASLDPVARVPWGLGMRAPSFVTARLMETWAHGLDVHAALGVEAVDTDRLRHVAWLAIRALPYAYSVAGRADPATPLRVELDGPGGERWSFGPADAADVISGPAGVFCRLFVKRIERDEATGLEARGRAAEAALDVARAYL